MAVNVLTYLETYSLQICGRMCSIY